MRTLAACLLLTGAAVAGAQPLPGGFELAPSDGIGGLYGTSVAVSADTALVGASVRAVGQFSHAGAAFVYVNNGGVWTQQQRLEASDPGLSNYFGGYLEILGERAYVSAFGHTPPGGGAGAGAVYVFARNGNSWSQIDKLVPPGLMAGAQYGFRIAVNDAYLLLSSRNASNRRIVQVLEPVAGAWQPTTSFEAGNNEGISHIALWRSTVVVGSSAAAVGGVASGRAFVYDRVGNSFVPTISLDPPGGATGDSAGFSVAIWGDTIAVGAFQDDVGANANQGSVHVYRRGQNGWVHQVQLFAPDGLGGDEFGKDLRVCGERIIVGAPRRDEGANLDQGAIYVYDRVGGSWTFAQKATLDPPGRSNSLFGDHLAVDARNLVAGAPFMNRAYAFAGGCAVQEVLNTGFE